MVMEKTESAFYYIFVINYFNQNHETTFIIKKVYIISLYKQQQMPLDACDQIICQQVCNIGRKYPQEVTEIQKYG